MFYSVEPVYGLDQPVEYVEMDYEGQTVLASKTPEGYRLERIYSIDPYDYTRPEFLPGTIIDPTKCKIPNNYF